MIPLFLKRIREISRDKFLQPGSPLRMGTPTAFFTFFPTPSFQTGAHGFLILRVPSPLTENHPPPSTKIRRVSATPSHRPPSPFPLLLIDYFGDELLLLEVFPCLTPRVGVHPPGAVFLATPLAALLSRFLKSPPPFPPPGTKVHVQRHLVPFP